MKKSSPKFYPSCVAVYISIKTGKQEVAPVKKPPTYRDDDASWLKVEERFKKLAVRGRVRFFKVGTTEVDLAQIRKNIESRAKCLEEMKQIAPSMQSKVLARLHREPGLSEYSMSNMIAWRYKHVFDEAIVTPLVKAGKILRTKDGNGYHLTAKTKKLMDREAHARNNDMAVRIQLRCEGVITNNTAKLIMTPGKYDRTTAYRLHDKSGAKAAKISLPNFKLYVLDRMVSEGTVICEKDTHEYKLVGAGKAATA
jgi:hypothetical protein